MNELYIGLMTGTSMDGIDAVIVDFSQGAKILATHSEAIPNNLLATLHQLTLPGANEIDTLGQADVELGKLLATAAQKVMSKASVKPEQITAIGSHGQTIRHRPQAASPFTLQIGDPNTIAVHTRITTVADFRRKDMALGGQGAPLVPFYHQTFMQAKNKNRIILNIGGIANITLLPSNGEVSGFDTGPGNALLDAWCLQHQQKAYDAHGGWAATGELNETLLETMLADPYFAQTAPKSTGKEYFNLAWLNSFDLNDTAENIQRTLVELTARSIIDTIARSITADEIIVCGGGVHNQLLMLRLSMLATCPVLSSAALGIDPDWVEACAFAWFAKNTLAKATSNLPNVTGATRAAVLGGIYYP